MSGSKTYRRHHTGIKCISQIRTTELDEPVHFYVLKLGFQLLFRSEEFYAGVQAGKQVFHLKLVDAKDPSNGLVSEGDHLHLNLTTDDAETKAEEVERNGVSLLKPLAGTPWAMEECAVLDNHVHTLYFGQS